MKKHQLLVTEEDDPEGVDNGRDVEAEHQQDVDPEVGGQFPFLNGNGNTGKNKGTDA
jgi:hypothetical protein